MLIWDQFGIIQNLQTIPQISFLTGTFFATSWRKPALVRKFIAAIMMLILGFHFDDLYDPFLLIP